MIGDSAIAVEPLAASPQVPIAQASGYFFDPNQVLLSEYANSPVTTAMADFMAQWFDPAARFNAFFSKVWNIDTAEGYGLDMWGRRLGVKRVLTLPAGSPFLGFKSDPAAKPYGFGILYRGSRSTMNVALTDDAYRTLLLAKAAFNIAFASIPQINSILLNLFGNGHVRDNLNMTMTLVFTRSLTSVENAIALQSGVIPKPCGVSMTVEQP